MATESSIRALVERFIEAVNRRDTEALAALLHPEYFDEMPQSGELVRGAANMAAIIDHYPGGLEMGDAMTDATIIGTDERWVMTPGFAAIKVVGADDVYIVTGRVRYPDGSYWHLIVLARLKDGLIHPTTRYYAPEFPAPEWRSEWVEPIDGSRVVNTPPGQD
jgi:hypothetical protein